MSFLKTIENFNRTLRADLDCFASGDVKLNSVTPYSNGYITVLLIDRSGSMSADDYPPSRLQAAINAAVEYVQALPQKDTNVQIAVVSFGHEASMVLPPTSVKNLKRIIDAIYSITIQGCTDIAKGLAKAERILAKCPSKVTRKQIILLSDGHGGQPIAISQKLKQQFNAVIDVIGIGGSPDDVDESLLRQIATTDSNGYNHYRFIRDSHKLKKHYRQLATSLVYEGDNQ